MFELEITFKNGDKKYSIWDDVPNYTFLVTEYLTEKVGDVASIRVSKHDNFEMFIKENVDV